VGGVTRRGNGGERDTGGERNIREEAIIVSEVGREKKTIRKGK